MNNETFDSVVGADLVNIILACPIVAVVLAFAITVMLLVVYTKRDQWKKRSPLTISCKATLLSLTVINGSYASAFFVMDFTAVSNRDEQFYPIHGQGKIGEPYNVLYNIPVVVFVLDLLATIPSSLGIAPVLSYACGNINNFTDNQCYIVALLSTIGVIISLLNHTPYIVMAYFIDPYYTTGVLIFYIFFVISWFSLLEFLFDSSLRKPQNTASTRNNAWGKKCKHSCARFTFFLVLYFSYMGLAYAIFLYLTEIPIKPVFIAIGSFALYKLVSRRKRLWSRQNTVHDQGTQQLEENEALIQDHSQDAEQQPLLSPQ